MISPMRTERLVLRRWSDDDRDAFAQLNSDPLVMEMIGQVMDRSASDAFMDRIEKHFADYGYGLWCVELGGESIGFTGLYHPWWRDGVEIGWRLRSERWGQGYATEAARAALATGFTTFGLDEVISFTAAINTRSQRVMEKLGLQRDASADFDHPSVPVGSPLRRHVLYRIAREGYGERP